MKKIYLVETIIITALFAGALGYAAGISNKKQNANLVQPRIPAAEMPDSNFLFGTVDGVNGSVITLNTPSGDDAPQARQVTVTSGTKIIRFENKPAEIIKKEQAEYAKKMASYKPTSDTPPPPSPHLYVEKEVTISDINPGDKLSVEAKEMLRLKKEFNAVKISLQSNQPPATTAPIPVSR